MMRRARRAVVACLAARSLEPQANAIELRDEKPRHEQRPKQAAGQSAQVAHTVERSTRRTTGARAPIAIRIRFPEFGRGQRS